MVPPEPAAAEGLAAAAAAARRRSFTNSPNACGSPKPQGPLFMHFRLQEGQLQGLTLCHA